MRILLVHPDPNAISSLAAALCESGFDVCTAPDGIRALESAQQTWFDVLVVSDGIGDLDPHEVCRVLRSMDHQGPIMALVGRGRQELIAAIDAGADISLADPISTDELLARVRALLRRYRAR